MVLFESRLYDEGVGVDVAVAVVFLGEGTLHHGHLVQCAFELLLFVPVERHVVDDEVTGLALHPSHQELESEVVGVGDGGFDLEAIALLEQEILRRLVYFERVVDHA